MRCYFCQNTDILVGKDHVQSCHQLNFHVQGTQVVPNQYLLRPHSNRTAEQSLCRGISQAKDLWVTVPKLKVQIKEEKKKQRIPGQP